MLELMDLGCERDDRTLFRHLSITLSPAELLQVEGGNGTGKTTLLKILAGLSNDYRGSIFWKGKPLSRDYADFRLSSFYFGHKPAIKVELTPVENILWRSSLRNEHCNEQSIIEALKQVNLGGYEDTPCGHLSAGQHRRVALADLSVSNALLWILDEPFTAIDYHGIQWLERLLAKHVTNKGMVIITSHQALSDQVLSDLSGRVRKIRLDDYVPAESGNAHEDKEDVFL
ncbi:cytochrome c biogenesis heme-transporting ATPase CcmA [Endozoicomonas lisbonensis]|uniref:Heme exporter protein A n=1 Tax=Endozoicomonas lisbonensis TaxID=3120522 RepID=A0ABV2SNU0_9GAMM